MPKITKSNSLKWKNVFKSKHFRSSLCFIFFSVSTIFLFISILILFQRAHQIREELESKASYAAISVQDIINTTKNNATLVGSLPSVGSVLNTPSPTVDQLSVMINDVSSFSTMYDYDNMGVFFEKSRRVFDSDYGIYHYEDYIHPSLLNAVYESSTYERWILLPAQELSAAGGNTVLLTYIHRLPFYETRGKGFIVFSLSIKYLQSHAATSLSSIPYPATVCFQDQLLWSSSDTVAAQWDNSKTGAQNTAVLFPHAKEYSFATEAGTQVSFYVTGIQLWKSYLSALRPLISAWFFSILLCFVLSFLFSLLMLRPMDALMHKMGQTPYMENADTKLDEYSLLNAALDNMAQQMENIGTIMQKNKQLIQDQLLHGILYGYVNPQRLSDKYGESGITFSCANFALILTALPGLEETTDYAMQEQIRLLARNNAVSAFSNLGQCYSIYLGAKYVAIILNTDHWEHLRAELLKICAVIRTSLQETISLSPLFSISLCSPDKPSLYSALLQAQRILLFSSGETDEFVYFSSQQEYTPTIDPDLMMSFTQCIMNKDSALLKDLTDRFSRLYLPEGIELSEAKRLSRIALCSVFVNLMELNIDMKENLLPGGLSRLDSAQNAGECDHIIFSCLCGMTNDGIKISDEAHSYIRKAIRYLEAHYAEPLSIPQIASHTGVSAIYLNRIFKLSTGKTLSEYLNEYRTSQSLPMLSDTSDTINRISENVGYNDVRSYIRFFKKFYGMTPSEYRKGAGGSP